MKAPVIIVCIKEIPDPEGSRSAFEIHSDTKKVVSVGISLAVNLAQAVELREDGIVVEKLRRVGYEVVMAPVPALVTVSSEVGDLRLPTLKAIQDARKKPVTVWNAADLGIDVGMLRSRSIRSLSSPPSRARTCMRIEGSTPQEKDANLAFQLRQDKVI